MLITKLTESTKKIKHLPPVHVLQSCLARFKDNPFILGRGTTTKYWICPGAKRGNSVYARRQSRVVGHVINQFDISSGKCLWITCTQRIDYTSIRTIQKSYEDIRKYLPKYIRVLKKFGTVKHMYVYEAHERGGAHAHILFEMFDKPETVLMKGKLRLADTGLLGKIKSAWSALTSGNVDVRVASSHGVTRYISKELTKNSNVEAAIKRILEGKPLKNDVNRVWGFYFMVVRLKTMRAWGTSRNVKKIAKKSERLDLIMNNSTTGDLSRESGGESGEKVRTMVLGKGITTQSWFIPFTGAVTCPEMERELDLIVGDYFVVRHGNTVPPFFETELQEILSA